MTKEINNLRGSAFEDVWDRDIHVLKPFKIPESWFVDRTFIWGYKIPFSVGWWAESDGSEVELEDGTLISPPAGTLFRIHEYYGWGGEPNKGCMMSPKNLANNILVIEKSVDILKDLIINPGSADISIYNKEYKESRSIAENMEGWYDNDGLWVKGIKWKRQNKRPGGRTLGLQIFRKYLDSSKNKSKIYPGLFIFDTCLHFINTVPSLSMDQNGRYDINTNSEDIIYNECRYRLVSNYN